MAVEGAVADQHCLTCGGGCNPHSRDSLSDQVVRQLGDLVQQQHEVFLRSTAPGSFSMGVDGDHVVATSMTDQRIQLELFEDGESIEEVQVTDVTVLIKYLMLRYLLTVDVTRLLGTDSALSAAGFAFYGGGYQYLSVKFLDGVWFRTQRISTICELVLSCAVPLRELRALCEGTETSPWLEKTAHTALTLRSRQQLWFEDYAEFAQWRSDRRIAADRPDGYDFYPAPRVLEALNTAYRSVLSRLDDGSLQITIKDISAQIRWRSRSLLQVDIVGPDQPQSTVVLSDETLLNKYLLQQLAFNRADSVIDVRGHRDDIHGEFDLSESSGWLRAEVVSGAVIEATEIRSLSNVLHCNGVGLHEMVQALCSADRHGGFKFASRMGKRVLASIPFSPSRHSRVEPWALEDAHVAQYRRRSAMTFGVRRVVATAIVVGLLFLVTRGQGGWVGIAIGALIFGGMLLYVLSLTIRTHSQWFVDRRLALAVRDDGVVLPRVGFIPWERISEIRVPFRSDHFVGRGEGALAWLGSLDKECVIFYVRNLSGFLISKDVHWEVPALPDADGTPAGLTTMRPAGLKPGVFYDTVQLLWQKAEAANIPIVTPDTDEHAAESQRRMKLFRDTDAV